jgi:Cd2+/Zn2+-exporting ATPase
MKVFLEGLNCASCASKIERLIKKMPDVIDANISLATGIVMIDEGDGFSPEEIYETVVQLVQSLEPHVVVSKQKNNRLIDEVSGCDDQACHLKNNLEYVRENEPKKKKKYGEMFKRQQIELFVGIGLFVLGFVFKAFLTNDFQVLTIATFISAYLISGYHVIIIAFRNIGKGQIFDENFLMTIATFGALILGEWPEAAAVMIFFGVGEFFQDRAIGNARALIAQTISINAIIANRLTADGVVVVDAKSVKVDDVLIIKPGEKVPADGIVQKGSSYLDTSALTGESYPRRVKQGDEILSGMINGNDVLEIIVTKDFENSTAMKIMHLIEEAGDKKGKTEKFITKFSRYYTPMVVSVAVLMAIIPPLFIPGAIWADWFNKSLIFLVVSCPCALVLSIPISYFGGIGRASKEGVLVKGGNYLDVLSKSNVFVFDKTGTLTKGQFKVVKVETESDISKDVIIRAGFLGEFYSNHPIGKAIREYRKITVDKEEIKNYSEIPGKGTYVEINNQVIRIGKSSYLEEFGVTIPKNDEEGTIVYVSIDTVFAGYFVLDDVIKDNAKQTIKMLKKLGVKQTIMLSGDNQETAQRIGAQLNLDQVIGECLPQDKVQVFEEIMAANKEGKTIFVGDGMNDAPVLARADAGIAMGALGSDSAIEAADIVLMKDDPMDIVKAVDISRYAKKIMIQNIVLALGIKIAILGLTVIGMGEMYLAIFADVGAAILTILNTGRILRYKGIWK